MRPTYESGELAHVGDRIKSGTPAVVVEVRDLDRPEPLDGYAGGCDLVVEMEARLPWNSDDLGHPDEYTTSPKWVDVRTGALWYAASCQLVGRAEHPPAKE